MDTEPVELPVLNDILSENAMEDLPGFILVASVPEEESERASPWMRKCAAVINERYGQDHMNGRGSYLWLDEEAAMEIRNVFQLTDDLTIVFEEFDERENSFFRYVVSGNRQNKFLGKPTVIGPWILADCLEKVLPVPKSVYAMWSLSMKDIVISFSGLDVEGPDIDYERKKLKAKVHRLAGHVTRDFIDTVTHLVCDSSKKEKYKVARERRLPIMKKGWIDAVYGDALRNPAVHALDPKYAQFKFRCFDGLVITLSQIPRREKAVLQKLIEDNGGKVVPELKIRETDFLVAGSGAGEKVMAAADARIEVLTQSWVHDCTSCGYLLEPAEYRVIRKKTSTSTPTKTYNDRSLFEASRFSAINDTHTLASITIQETQCETSCSVDDFRSSERSDNVGASLSGSRIFIYGSKQAAHWKKIIRAAGGVVCGDINDDVTHLVAEVEGDNQPTVAQAVTQLLRAYPGANPMTVTTEWLKRCIDENRHVDESNFMLHAPRVSVVPSSTQKPAHPTREDTKLVRQSSASVAKPQAEAAHQEVGDDRGEMEPRRTEESEEYTETMEEDSEFFRLLGNHLRGKRVIVIDDPSSDSEDCQNISAIVLEYGAIVLPQNTTEIADLAFVYLNIDDPGPPSCDLAKLKARELRTNLWLNDCTELGEVAPVHYYHRPLPSFVFGQSSLLEGCVIVPTSFSGAHREYIKVLATALGAICSELLSRRDNPEKGYNACTHLIAKSPDGQKYMKAKDWGVHTVSVEWLVKCAFQRTRLPESSYPVLKPKDGQEEETTRDLDEYVLEQLQAMGCRGMSMPDSNVLQLLTSSGKENQIPDIPESQDPEDEAELTLRADVPDTEPLPEIALNSSATSVTSPNVSRRRSTIRPVPVEPKSPPVSLPRDGVTTQRHMASAQQGLGSRKRGFAELKANDHSQESSGEPRKPRRIVANSQIWEKHHKRAREAFQSHQVPSASPATITYSRKYRIQEQRREDVVRAYNDEGRKRVVRPLAGEVLMIIGKNPGVVSKYADLAAELGAISMAHYDDSITYVVVHEDSRADPLVKTAQADCKFLVSHHWLDRCKEEAAHVPSSMCPWNLVKTPPVDTSFEEIPELPASQGARKRVHVEIERAPLVDVGPSRHDEDSEDPNLRDDMRRLAQMADARRLSSRRPSETPSAASSQQDSQPLASNLQPVITWQDPVAMRTRQSMEALVRQSTQRPKPLTMMHMNASYLTEGPVEALPETEPVEELPLTPPPPSPPQPKRVFSLSKLDANEVLKVQQIIEQLGGEVVNSRNLVDGITHFVAPVIARSEKALGLIAAGAWMLHTSYVYDSGKAGKFLPEADYEWGSPNLREAALKLGAEKDLANSARFWRMKREAEGQSNSFSEYRVTVHAGPKSVSFERVMKAGGALIINTKLPLKDPDVVNLVVADGKDLESIEFPALALKGIPVVNPTFTAFHLSSCGQKALSASYVKPYADALKKLGLK